MPKLNVGLTKKIGLPEYGSLSATCQVELDTENLLQGDLAAFHDRVKQIFAACRQAVNDELARQQPAIRETGPRSSADGSGNGSKPASATGRTSNPQNGNRPNSNGFGATTKQLDYVEQLAKQIRGVGKRGLEQLAQKMFGKPVSEISGMDASGLIDTLKAIKSGEIDVEQALNGAEHDR
jgi:hypothetical protein